MCIIDIDSIVIYVDNFNICELYSDDIVSKDVFCSDLQNSVNVLYINSSDNFVD